MITKIFTVYDSKAEAYLQPFFMPNRGQAIRAFQDTVNDPKTQFHKHPSDFSLFEIGTYDDLSGAITMHDAKVNLGTAVEFLKTSPLHMPSSYIPHTANGLIKPQLSETNQKELT